MIWNTLLGWVPSLISSVGEAYKTNRTIKAAKDDRKHELRVKSLDNKLESIKRGSESDMAMDQSANQRIAWADDVSFIVFLAPCLLAFYAPAVPHIRAGFLILESMPQWYQVSLGMMLISVWGYRRIVTPIIEMIAKSYMGIRK
jgi:hypothetical protein